MPVLIAIALIWFIVWWHGRGRAKPALPEAVAEPPREPRQRKAREQEPLKWATRCAIRIYYVDRDGETTERTVAVQRFGRRYDESMFEGHCTLRNAFRTFRLGRVNVAFDPGTGEVIRDLWAHFAAASSDDAKRPAREAKLAAKAAEMAHPLDRHADAVRALIFVGKADGRLMATERAVIVEACVSLGALGTSDADVQAAVQRYGVPSPDEFAAVTDRLAAQAPDTLRVVAAASERIVATQKTTHAAEHAALTVLRAHLRATQGVA